MNLLQKHPILCCLAFLCLILLVWIYWESYTPKTTVYSIPSEKLPASFQGLRIAQVSDLHNTRFGKDHRKLLRLLTDAKPDMILLTGDLLDSRRTNLESAIGFCKTAVSLAPIYYAPGNHESRIPADYAALKTALSELGVIILENESVSFRRGTDSITLTGLMDPDFGIPWPDVSTEEYQIVLSHRPELLEQYAQMELDLVFSGHAHGGQFRLPLIGGVFAPQQGFFPDYTAGVHTKDNTTLVISRGLGNAPIIPRFNNSPELILVTLESI